MAPRASISKHGEHYIPKFRYYELLYFCKQYPVWEEAKKARLSHIGGSVVNVNAERLESGLDEKFANIEDEPFYKNIQLVDGCIAKLDTEFKDWVAMGVTHDMGYDTLVKKGMPFCKEAYFKHYRHFFWLLSKVRG